MKCLLLQSSNFLPPVFRLLTKIKLFILTLTVKRSKLLLDVVTITISTGSFLRWGGSWDLLPSTQPLALTGTSSQISKYEFQYFKRESETVRIREERGQGRGVRYETIFAPVSSIWGLAISVPAPAPSYLSLYLTHRWTHSAQHPTSHLTVHCVNVDTSLWPLRLFCLQNVRGSGLAMASTGDRRRDQGRKQTHLQLKSNKAQQRGPELSDGQRRWRAGVLVISLVLFVAGILIVVVPVATMATMVPGTMSGSLSTLK